MSLVGHVMVSHAVIRNRDGERQNRRSSSATDPVA
jgi:hypothetical protein